MRSIAFRALLLTQAACLRHCTFENYSDDVTEIVIEHQGITTLDKSIGKFKRLKKLNLWNNEIQKLPDEIGDLENLEKLYLSYNDITELPKTMCKLKKLKEFYISNNRLTAVPDEIGDLTNLVILNLNNNRIRDLSDGVEYLTKLKEMRLQNNELTLLPYTIISLCDTLDILDLTGNDIQDVGNEVTLGKIQKREIVGNLGTRLTVGKKKLRKMFKEKVSFT